MLAVILAATLAVTNDPAYERILAADDALMAQPLTRNVIQNANWRARLRRVEADYKLYIATHPGDAQAVADYAGFLYDQGRHDEAVTFWERALKLDPKFARVYNDLAVHYGHYGRAADALRYHQKAFELDPSDPVFHFNWATTCFLFRKDAKDVYGWSEDEIFRHSLDEFRKARDLATNDYEYATAYAQSFFMWKKADWQEAAEAWQFCVNAAPSEVERQRAYGYVARADIRLGRYDDARAALDKITLPELRSVRDLIARQLPQ
jgi:tetratricopeptide (TPR) repeat protein